eukprot:FR743375.1.p1 GENE.FR743375.1~~FR743375.1.p1  ORF type:complete len:204 (+),score=23.77 FR743375.1:1-612(+)
MNKRIQRHGTWVPSTPGIDWDDGEVWVWTANSDGGGADGKRLRLRRRLRPATDIFDPANYHETNLREQRIGDTNYDPRAMEGEPEAVNSAGHKFSVRGLERRHSLDAARADDCTDDLSNNFNCTDSTNSGVWPGTVFSEIHYTHEARAAPAGNVAPGPNGVHECLRRDSAVQRQLVAFVAGWNKTGAMSNYCGGPCIRDRCRW